MTEGPVANRSIRLRAFAIALIVAVTVFRAVYLFLWCPYDLAPDEGHYWDWSRHLDLSYYSKGPLIAWLIRLGCEVFGDLAMAVNGTLMPAIRVPAVICGGLTLGALYTFTYQTYRSDRLALGVVLVILTLPSFLALSVVMTIDAPFLCCWSWALVLGRMAAIDNKFWAWPATGLLVALGILAKYTMALWGVSAVLFVLFTPTHRYLLLRAGPWIMGLVAATSAIPILIWNSANNWVTFRHVAVQAGVADSPKNSGFRPEGPLIYIGEQFAPLFGYWFVLWLIAVVVMRPWRITNVGVRYAWWMSVPTFTLFGVTSFTTKVQVNWPVAAYLSGAALIAGWLSQIRPRTSVRVAIVITMLLGTAITIMAHHTRYLYIPLVRSIAKPESVDRPTPIRPFDITARLKGWKYLSQELDRLRGEIRAREGKEAKLAGGRWDIPGILGVYSEGRPQAYSFGLAMKDRHSQYDLWRPNPIDDAQEFLGKTFLVVAIGDPTPDLKSAFESLSPAQEVVYREDGLALARWYVVEARGFKGFDLTKRPANAGH